MFSKSLKYYLFEILSVCYSVKLIYSYLLSFDCLLGIVLRRGRCWGFTIK